MMFPWRTVGLHAPSSSSAATCAQRVEEDGGQNPTDPGPCFLRGNVTPTIPHKYSKKKVHISRTDVQTQLLRMEGEAATSMRLTLGCGSLDVVSLALAV